MEGYGDHCFTGVVADSYLRKHGGDGSLLKTAAWTTDNAQAEVVAAAVLSWAIDNGADTFCHWFQPLASNGLRPGLSGQVQNKMVRCRASSPAAAQQLQPAPAADEFELKSCLKLA